ncbi:MULTISPECIES: hypothetical protein [unclassified Butyrivibrio]|uniref:hypothetical protein n=1 Tax=unclassified Butyrivibrio TaxID=2639466 RepID=UPI000411E833|nr:MULTISPECIES: hypothetical protein [unclassified Butyrivibrio]SCY47256.1 hypothetical protein SAMN02910371_02436 [Butyrivibrio sp. INlla14]
MNDKIIMIFHRADTNETFDIEVPTDITANELIYGLNKGLGLGINMDNPADAYLRSINPIALLRGDDLIEDFHLHGGTTIIFDRPKGI